MRYVRAMPLWARRVRGRRKQSTIMKLRLFAATLLLASNAAFAAAPSPFELHDVADTASDHTKEYTLALRKGHDAEKVLLDTAVLLDRTALKAASVGHSEGGPTVMITLTEAGGKRFGAITSSHVGKRIAIVLDGHLSSAPVVRDPILGGSLEISGNFTEAEAADLVRKLNQSIAQ